MSAVILMLLASPGGALAPDVEAYRLDNGLRVLLLEDAVRPWVSVQAWYDVGTAHDPATQPGWCRVAHEVVRQRGRVPLQLSAREVWTDAIVLPDACGFLSATSPESLEWLLRLTSQRMVASSPDRDAVAVALAHATDVVHSSQRRLLAALFRGHGYAHSPATVAATLADVEPEALGAFIDRWFAPANATLLVIGDFDPAAARRMIEAHFAPLPWRSVPQHAAQELPSTQRVLLDPGEEEEIGVAIAWLTPRMGRFENVALDVLLHRLGNPVDGMLRDSLEPIGAGRLKWRRVAYADAGYLQLTVHPSNPGEMRDATTLARLVDERVQAALEAATSQPATPIELNRGRALTELDVRKQLDDSAAQLRYLGIATIVGGDARLPRYVRRRIERVNVGDLQAAARALLDARRVIVPLAPGSTDRVTDLPVLRDPAHELAAPDLCAYLADACAPPAVIPTRTMAVVTWTVDDRLRFAVRAMPDRLLAEVRTCVPGPPIAAVSLLEVGSAQRDAAGYREYLTYHGIDLRAERSGERAVDLVASGPPDKVPQMIELQLDLLRDLRRDAGAPAAGRDAAAADVPRRVDTNAELVVQIVGDVDAAGLRGLTQEVWGAGESGESDSAPP